MRQTHLYISGILLGLLAIGYAFISDDSLKEVARGTASAEVIRFDHSIVATPGVPIKVAKVVDGDTAQLINEEYIRYIGIDTPEEFDPRKPVQCYAKEAAELNRQLVEGKNIIFYQDVSKHDKYGRLLGFIYLEDGTFVNKELVKRGAAFSYVFQPDISKTAELRQAETEARQAKLGLWENCTVTRVSGGREQTNNI